MKLQYTVWLKSPKYIVDKGSRNIVIFIHGIFSDHNTFEKMMDLFKERLEKRDTDEYWEIGYIDYDYSISVLDNGKALDQELRERFNNNEKIILVCHSMGGLIARSAILSNNESNKSIKKLIMLGTPNFGAICSSQLSLLSQIILNTSGLICGVFLRKRGLKELTDIPKLFSRIKGNNESKARDIDYITIPGTFFNMDRGFLDAGDHLDKWKSFFMSINIVTEIISKLLPLFEVRMEKPHDGIVEERSNKLIPAGSGRWSEKSGSINHPGDFKNSYVHIEHNACDKLLHVEIHKDAEIIELVLGLVLANDLNTWYRGLSIEQKAKLRIEPSIT